MVELIDISYNEIEVIKDLWEKNRQYHENSSEYFRELYHNMGFEERIGRFSVFDKASIKITVAGDNGEYIGYCISTAVDGKGEVESLHVNESFRGSGVGRQLVQGHLEWMKDKGCSVIGVTVSQENEPTIGFYRKLGFLPHTLYMQQK